MENQVASSHEPRATSHVSFADSHAHVVMFEESERASVLARAREAGVRLAIIPGTTLEDSREAARYAESEEGLFAAAGIHPHEAKAAPEDFETPLSDLARSDRVVGIGEIGLDFHYDHSPRARQMDCFERQIGLARRIGKPVIVHVRDAFDEADHILRSGRADEVGGVIHCFTGTYEQARRFLDQGFFISFSGILTFPKSDSLREAARRIPIERTLIETDAPYLAPLPVRGRKNEPAYLPYTAQVLADVKKLHVHDVARVTRVNTRRVFRIANGHVSHPPNKPSQWAGHFHLEPKIAYRIRNALYLNITNKCTIACVFCPKFDDFMVKGHYLKLAGEPSMDTVLGELGDFAGVEEVVFCGFGESTLRLELLKEVARQVKARGVRVRLDTDGLGSLVHGRNIIPELVGLIDSISVSLNAADGAQYATLCPSRHGEAAYEAVKDFIREARKHLPDVQATVVTVPGLDVEKCRRIVEEDLGVRFRPREYNNVG